MHEFYQIKEAVAKTLGRMGFKFISEENSYDNFGSIQALFQTGEKQVLLTWDGKDGLGYASVNENGESIILSSKVPESSAEEFQYAIDRLCSNIESAL